MKRIITLNAIILFVYFLVSNAFLEWKEDYLVDNYAGEFQNFKFSKSVDVVNVGTSHGSVSFNWKLLKEINGINLGRSGQPLKYDYLLLEKYKEYLADSIIVVPISFGSFCLDSSSFTPYDALFEGEFPFLGAVQTSESINLLIDSASDRSFPSEAFLNHSKVTPSGVPSECEKNIIRENVSYLAKILETYNVVLVTTPHYIPSLDDIDKFEEFYKIIDQLAYQHNSNYFDYSRDSRFLNQEYFYDSKHLNSLGRLKFINIFVEEVLVHYFD